MTDAARRRAEACFAVARSATIPGEKAAALNRGRAIVEAAGLSLDDFDVPGRVGKPNRGGWDRARDGLFEGGGPARGYTYASAFDLEVAIGPDDPRFADLFAAVLDEMARRGW